MQHGRIKNPEQHLQCFVTRGVSLCKNVVHFWENPCIFKEDPYSSKIPKDAFVLKNLVRLFARMIHLSSSKWLISIKRHFASEWNFTQ